MLTKDFIKAVVKLGYGVDNDRPHTLYVETPDVEPEVIVSFCKDKTEPAIWAGTFIPATDAKALVELVEEYDNTPLEEREETNASETLKKYSLEELAEAVSKKILNEYDPNVQVLISQERISFYEPKWSIPSEWAFHNL